MRPQYNVISTIHLSVPKLLPLAWTFKLFWILISDALQAQFNSFYTNFFYLQLLFIQVKIKLYMVAAVGGCVVLFSSLLLAALLLHLRRRQEHKYLRQVLPDLSFSHATYFVQPDFLPPFIFVCSSCQWAATPMGEQRRGWYGGGMTPRYNIHRKQYPRYK